MSQDKVRKLLIDLRKELANSREVDPETLELARKLDEDIDAYIEESEQVNSPVLDDAIALEARFAATHPVAERLTRELIAVLGRMGI